MEPSQFLTPAVAMAVIGAIVGLIVKAVRLQTKVDRLDEQSSEQKVAIAKIERESEHHRANQDIHFNLRLHQEIEKRQDDRFHRVEGRLGHIEDKIDSLLNK